MSAFDEAFDVRHEPISSRQRDSLFDGGGETLNSADDGPSTDLSSDSAFVGSDTHDDDDAPPLWRSSAAAANGGGSGDLDESDDGDDDDTHVVAVSRPRADHRATAARCPVCWDEQPYIADSSKRTAMSERFVDYREIMYRYYNAVRGSQPQDTVLCGMLDIRREKIERYLVEYSSERFVRWTMAILRIHFDPRHRFDPGLALDKELDELDELKQMTKQHGMWVDDPRTGERAFNLRGVEVRLRISRDYQQCVQRKAAELDKRVRSGQAGGESDAIMQALVEHSVGAKRRSKRRRDDGESAVDHMYQLGRL